MPFRSGVVNFGSAPAEAASKSIRLATGNHSRTTAENVAFGNMVTTHCVAWTVLHNASMYLPLILITPESGFGHPGVVK